MCQYQKSYEAWCNDPAIAEEDRKALCALTDEKEIRDRFYTELDFGTAGLRGVMGLGANRMNRYTVARATLGLATVLQGERDAFTRGVAIGYDTRNNSAFFARVAADVLTAKGFSVKLFDRAVPTPVLSFAVRELGCAAGIVITASHNPKEYNGYKVYDETGCQLLTDKAKAVTDEVARIKDFSLLPKKGNDALLETVGEELLSRYEERLLSESIVSDESAKAELSVVFTAIHGTGSACTPALLRKDGFRQLALVEEQMVQDGNFPTVKSPNPEEKGALQMGLSLAEEIGADLVVGTDPDADRMGCAARRNGVMTLLSGNQVGALLLDFILKVKKPLPDHPVMINTVVSGELGGALAKSAGVEHVQVLTGFKYIGERITAYEKERALKGDSAPAFLLGYEESYGYLVGEHARDKDASVASMLVCEMAAYHKAQGRTLHDALEELYAKHGYYLDVVESVTLPGKEGMDRIAAMMRQLREEGAPLSELAETLDYQAGVADLPRANVLKFRLQCGSWIAVRPSGTEPKIKFYYSVVAESREAAEKKQQAVKARLYAALAL
ncbi:MAG: phospho-sugar mutase [Clostridia bacterium]|nr:phospho-sugar mutase [Clostridia bacterium]